MVTVIGLLAGAAHADPIALRLGADVTLVAGAPVVSVAAPVGERWSLAASHRFRSSLDLSAGYRRETRAPGTAARGWAYGASGGAVLPLWDPALAVSASVYGHRWRRLGGATTLRGGLAVPAALQLTGGASARLPVVAELLLARDLGPLTLGVYGGGGVAVVPGSGWALSGQAGLVLSGGGA